MTPTPAECALLTDPDARQVLAELATYDDDLCPYLRTIARDLDIPVEQLRRIVKALGALGLATYGPVYDQDTGAPAGSSWWLTTRGVALRAAMREDA